MKWKITFYSQKVEEETLSFPKGILANFLHIAEMIEEFGPALDGPYTKSLGQGLFEMRAKGKEGIGRSFFCMMKGKEVIILHSFVKKSQKIPQKRAPRPAPETKPTNNKEIQTCYLEGT